MLDTGATHNYLESTKVEQLGFLLEKIIGRVKPINSTVQPIAGITKSVLMKVGPYEERANFSVMVMDDFKVILKLEFLREIKARVMPCINSLIILGKNLCIISVITHLAVESFSRRSN